MPSAGPPAGRARWCGTHLTRRFDDADQVSTRKCKDSGTSADELRRAPLTTKTDIARRAGWPSFRNLVRRRRRPAGSFLTRGNEAACLVLQILFFLPSLVQV